MTLAIQDTNVLKSIEPQAFIAYLQANAWQQIDVIKRRAAILENAFDGKECQIVIPLNTEFADYHRRIAEALETLATFEHRSQYAILNDLAYTINDVIKIRDGSDVSESGTVQLQEGINLYKAAQDMMMAAACAALERRPVYHARKPDQAVKFVDALKIGPSEAGSFIATIVSPALTLSAEQNLFDASSEATSFEFSVVELLSRALAALREASEQVSLGEDINVFDSVVSQGVSANLCKAVVELGTLGEKAGFDVSFKWSSMRHDYQKLHRRIRIQQSSLLTIREAVRYFREKTPEQDFELQGIVIRLSRSQNDEDNEALDQAGEVVITGFVNGQLRKVSVELPGEMYNIAISAHRDRNTVACTGELVRTGNTYRLAQPRNFRVLEDED